jgi:hypothetical protein
MSEYATIPTATKPSIEPQELFYKDRIEEFQKLRPDLTEEGLREEIASKYNELPEEAKTVYKERANQLLEESKNKEDLGAKMPEEDLKQTQDVLEDIIEGALRKKVKTNNDVTEPFEDISMIPMQEPTSSNISVTESSKPLSSIEAGPPVLPIEQDKNEAPLYALEEGEGKEATEAPKEALEGLESTEIKEGGETIEEEKRKPETHASRTHEALSRAGKKGAAKRWGKKYEEEGVEKPLEEHKPKPKTKPGIDPEISEAFSKIGYLGGKARGGEDKRGANIDFKTHDALSKAGKMGAAKRWGQHHQGEETKKVSQSHIQTRSQKSSQSQPTGETVPENDGMEKQEEK